MAAALAKSVTSTTRLLGAAGMIGGAALFVVELRHAISGIPLNGTTIDKTDDVLYAIFGLGMAFTCWAIYQIGATGSKPLLRAAPFVPMLGFVAMFIGSILDIVGWMTPSENLLAGVAFPLILLGTLLVAILALVARNWAGWRKFSPLIYVLAIPLMLALPGEWNDVLVGLSWVLLGYAVFSTTAE